MTDLREDQAAARQRCSTTPELALCGPPVARPSTPIAAALTEYLARRGSAEEGLRLVCLVEALERGTLMVKSRKGSSTTARGTRLPPDWRPSPDDIAYALDRGMAPARVASEAEKFLNHWTAESGARACKCDWAACWRKWIIRAMEYGYGRTNHRGQAAGTDFAARARPMGADAILAGLARVAHGIAAKHNAAASGDGQISRGPDFARTIVAERGGAGHNSAPCDEA